MSNEDKRLDRIEMKLDKLDGTLDTIKTTLIRNTDSLEYHIKRTNLLEESLKEVDEDLKPIKVHVAQVSIGIKVILTLITITGVIVGILKYFN
jgi:uncharacterized coiled-coil protein SlyX